MAIKVRLTQNGILRSSPYRDLKTGITLTGSATSADLSGYRDAIEIYRSVLNGTLELVDGTMAELKALAGDVNLM